MDLSRANEISPVALSHTSPFTPPAAVLMLLSTEMVAPYNDTGPAMVKSALTVKADVLLVAPKLRPVKVLAKL